LSYPGQEAEFALGIVGIIMKGGNPMLQRISHFPITAYLAITGAVRSFKNDERGLSGVVVAILLILVAIFAVILIWRFLGGWIDEMWQRITQNSNTVTPR